MATSSEAGAATATSETLVEDAVAAAAASSSHYGTKPGRFETLNYTLSHEQKSEQNERVSRQMSAQAMRAVQSKRTNERCKQTSKRMNGGASGPLISSGFLVDLAHGAKTLDRGSRGTCVRLTDALYILRCFCQLANPFS